MLYSIWSSNARSNCSGGIDSRPIVESSRSKRGDKRRQRSVGHAPDRSERIVRPDARFRGHVAEHRRRHADRHLASARSLPKAREHRRPPGSSCRSL